MGAFLAALPLALPVIEIIATDVPKVIEFGLGIISKLKKSFPHHSTDPTVLTPMSTSDISIVQAMRLSGMKEKLHSELPDVAAKLTDDQLQMLLEIIYQADKKAVADLPIQLPSPVIPLDPSVPIFNDSHALTIGNFILNLLVSLLNGLTRSQPTPSKF